MATCVHRSNRKDFYQQCIGMKYPPNLSRNALRAFSSSVDPSLPSDDIRVSFEHPREPDHVVSLRELCLSTIADTWERNPRRVNLGNAENTNNFLSELNGNDLAILSEFIKDDLFWEKRYRNIFGPRYLRTQTGQWLKVFMEKHLRNWLEKFKASEESEESMLQQLEIYSPFVETLTVHNFQSPQKEDLNQHLPQFNIVLQNLSELKKIDLSVNIKDSGDDFIVGCSNLTEKDIESLALGIEFCDLHEFKLSGTKLTPQMAKRLGRALEKCPNLTVLHLVDCSLSDNGVISFLIGLSPDSLPAIEDLNLTNNFISTNGAFQLAIVLAKRDLKHLNLRLNPIKSDGACLLFGKISRLQKLQSINFSACSLDSSIGVILCKVIKECKSLRYLNLSVNTFHDQFGWSIAEEMKENYTLLEIDVRNTNLSPTPTMVLDDYIIRNRLKNNK